MWKARFVFGFLFCLIWTSNLFAFDFSSVFSESAYETKNPNLKKYLDFVKKDERCELAIAVVARSSATNAFKEIYEKYPAVLRCIGSTVFSKNTIKEKKGCTAFYLSPTDATMASFYPSKSVSGYNMIENKKCIDVFSELIKMPIGGYATLPVGNVLSGEEGMGNMFKDLSGGRGIDFESEAHLVYSSNKKYTDWYFNEKKLMEEKYKNYYAKAKKEKKIVQYANGEKQQAPVTDEKYP